MAKKTVQNDESANLSLAEMEAEKGGGETRREEISEEDGEEEGAGGEENADLNALESDLSQGFNLLEDDTTTGEEKEEDGSSEETTENVKKNFRNSLLPDEIEAQDRVEKAGKRARRRIYKQEGIMTEDGLIKVKREDTTRNKEYLELSASAKNGSVLKGRLTARRETPSGMILAEVQYGENFTVNIPAEYMFDMSLQPIREAENHNAVMKDLINRRMNSIVSFIVLNVKEKEGIAYGTHIHALARTAREFYVRPQRDQIPLMRKGMLAQAQIVQVNKIGVWVDVLGAECFIRQDEIDWLRRSDISELYHVGDTVTVRVLDIKPHTVKISGSGKELQTVTISASIKQTGENPNQKYYDQFEINATGQGEVTQVTDTGIFIIFSNKISVLCKLYDGPKQPAVGATVLAQITNKQCNPDAGEYHFSGIIKYTIKEKEI